VWLLEVINFNLTELNMTDGNFSHTASTTNATDVLSNATDIVNTTGTDNSTLDTPGNGTIAEADNSTLLANGRDAADPDNRTLSANDTFPANGTTAAEAVQANATDASATSLSANDTHPVPALLPENIPLIANETAPAEGSNSSAAHTAEPAIQTDNSTAAQNTTTDANVTAPTSTPATEPVNPAPSAAQGEGTSVVSAPSAGSGSPSEVLVISSRRAEEVRRGAVNTWRRVFCLGEIGLDQ
jgi:hypothetical protein